MKNFVWILLLLLTSCNHKELCYNHPHTAPVRVNVDWSRFEPYEKPTGMTLTLYPEAGQQVFTRQTNATSHAVMNLPADRYLVLVYNQSPSEFGSFKFQHMDNPLQASVIAEEHSSRWYATRGEEERVATEPEWLGVGNYADAQVTEGMVEEQALILQQASAETRAGEPVIASVTPQNVIHTVSVEVHIQGMHNLRSARASLTGLSQGYYLAQGKRMDSEVTHLIEEWSATRNEVDPTKGYIQSSFTCFGLPDNHAGQAEENVLTLDLLLVDNRTIKTFVFHVGDKFTESLDESGVETEVHLELYLKLLQDLNGDPIVLPDVKPEGGSGSGFSATVDDWGEEIEHDIQM